MDQFEGKPLNSPHDICVRSDDTIWFSDPPLGILSNYQGNVSPIELPSNIYRLDPKTGRATVVESALTRPNGVEFSPDETKCYIQDSGSSPRYIYAYDVVDNGARLANKRVLITAEADGTPDGFRIDMDGNLWCGWGMAAPNLMASRCSIPKASQSASSRCRSAAPIYASVAASGTGCSWRRAIRSMRCI